MTMENQKYLLSSKEQESLLKLSRRVLYDHVLEGKVREDITKDFYITGALRKNSGVFVTLKKGGELRGCIGYIEPRKPLCQAVLDNTISASSLDPRFPPVTGSELKDIDIEISVLTPPKEIPDTTHFVVGKHGIILKKGCYSSVFLPQVAPEQGWDREKTLYFLSRKAGLDGNAWKEKNARFEIFTAQVFHEEK